MLEIEVKLKTEHNQILPILLGLGFVEAESFYEKDAYFNSKQVDLKKDDKALRIRTYRELPNGQPKYEMNYKGPKLDNTTMTREEVEFDIPSFEVGNHLLAGLGYFISGEVEKQRKVLKKESLIGCLDQVTGLGEYLELEIMAEESDYDQAISQIEEVLAKIGFTMSDTTRHSYLSMLEEKEN